MSNRVRRMYKTAHTYKGPSAALLEEVVNRATRRDDEDDEDEIDAAAEPATERPQLARPTFTADDRWRAAALVLSVVLIVIIIGGTLIAMRTPTTAIAAAAGSVDPAPIAQPLPVTITAIPLEPTPRGYALPNWAWNGQVEPSHPLCISAHRWGATNAATLCKKEPP
jgi:hypothetical protein